MSGHGRLYVDLDQLLAISIQGIKLFKKQNVGFLNISSYMALILL